MKRLAFSSQSRNFVITILYSIFAIYSIYVMVVSETLEQKILFGVLFIVIFSVALYAEYLRFLYHKAIKTIIMDADPIRGKEQFDQLLKKDIFKSYKSSRAVYDTLYYADMLDAEGIEQTLTNNEKYLHSSLDNLLIWHYNKLYSAFLKSDIPGVQEEYSRIIRMKDAKIKGHKLNPLYNWDFIDALYQMARKDYKKSYNTFNSISLDNLNNREKLHIYYQYYRLCKIMHNTSKADELKNKILKINGKAKIIEVMQNENE